MLENHFQFLHLKMKFAELDDWVLVIAIYRSPKWSLRKELWVELGNIAQNVKLPWIVAGDFNAMLDEEDKRGGSRRSRVSYPLFKKFCFDYCLKDAGFQGPRFTWSRGNVLERLDRVLFNHQWQQMVSRMVVYHLHHRPLAVCFDMDNLRRIARPFRFFSGWLAHSGFQSLVHEN